MFRIFDRATLAIGLFFLAFSAVFGLWPLAQMGFDTWQARSWQPVPATVVEAVHHKQRDDVVVRYRYEYGGRAYVGERIGLAPPDDNTSHWRRPWYERAVAARAGGAPLTAWVDPRQPARAVLDRGLPKDPALLRAFFLIFFVVGLGMAWHGVLEFLPARQQRAPGLPSLGPGFAARVPTLVFTGVFALAFGGAGVIFGALPLAETAHNAVLSRHWHPVQATVVDASLEGGGRSVRAEILYRYEFRGRSYQSDRTGLGRPMADNVGDWQRQVYRQGRQAQAAGRTITAWVDPERPHRSVLDRSIRWGMVMFHLPFALLFPAIGVAAAWVCGYVLRTGGTVDQALAAGITARLGPWLMVAFWCLVTWPLMALAWIEPAPALQRVLATLFALAGVGAVVLVARRR